MVSFDGVKINKVINIHINKPHNRYDDGQINSDEHSVTIPFILEMQNNTLNFYI